MLYGNREPLGRLGVSASALHDALAVVGEHTVDKSQAPMDGGLTRGLRAAREILEG